MRGKQRLLTLGFISTVLPIFFGLSDKAEARDCSTYGNDAGTTAWMGCIEAVYINRDNRFRRTVYFSDNNTPKTAIIDCSTNSVYWPDTRTTGYFSAGTILRKACTDYN